MVKCLFEASEGVEYQAINFSKYTLGLGVLGQKTFGKYLALQTTNSGIFDQN